MCDLLLLAAVRRGDVGEVERLAGAAGAADPGAGGAGGGGAGGAGGGGAGGGLLVRAALEADLEGVVRCLAHAGVIDPAEVDANAVLDSGLGRRHALAELALCGMNLREATGGRRAAALEVAAAALEDCRAAAAAHALMTAVCLRDPRAAGLLQRVAGGFVGGAALLQQVVGVAEQLEGEAERLQTRLAAAVSG